MPTFAQLKARFPNASLGFLAANASDGLPPELSPPRLAAPAAKPKPAAPRISRVKRTRNAGTWTEAQFWQRIRSCLRRMSVYWRPARAALIAARVPCRGPNGQKWAYLCADCNTLHPRKRVQLDHVIPCGALRTFEHMGEFLSRLLPEDAGAYKVRCLKCHQVKTNAERITESAQLPGRAGS